MTELSVRIANFAVNVAWQSSVVALLALAAEPLLRRAAARARHALLAFALLACAIVPVIAAFPRAVPKAMFPPPRFLAVSAARNDMGNGASVAVAYLGLVALATLRLAYGVRAARRLRHDITAVPQSIADAFDHGRDLLRMKRGRIALSARITSPVTVGSLILFPAPCNFDEATLCPAVAHELAHVKRRDSFLQLIIEAARVVTAFNPLVALLARRTVAAREMACDEMVASIVVEPIQYAKALLSVARNLSTPAFALGFGERDALEERVRFLRFLADGAPGRRRAGATSIIVAASLAVAAIALTSCSAHPFAHHEDLTGRWVMNRQQTQFGRTPPYASYTMNVDARRGIIRSSQQRVLNGKIDHVDWMIRSDGAWHPMTVRADHGVGRAAWKGDNLQFDLALGGGHFERSTVRLDAHGQTLVADGQIMERGGVTKYRFVFNRQGR